MSNISDQEMADLCGAALEEAVRKLAQQVDPLNYCIGMLQATALSISHIDRKQTVALLRAYADCMENPPETSAHKAGRKRFKRAGYALSAALAQQAASGVH